MKHLSCLKSQAKAGLQLFSVLGAAVAQIAYGSPAQSPNVVMIYADDWGWGDVGCHGNDAIKTPHIDRLAREGTDFQQFQVLSPVCSPSRAALLTGQFPGRNGINHALGGTRKDNLKTDSADWLDPEVVNLPRLFKEKGYRTAHFGKWHLGYTNRDLYEYGYDEYATWTGPSTKKNTVWAGTSYEPRFPGVRSDAANPVAAAFLTRAATEHAVRFIRESGENPFFINLWMHETHHLVSATEEDKAVYPDTPEPERTFYAALSRADACVGQVLDVLDELDLAENTIVIFGSDNGPEDQTLAPEKFKYSVGSTGGLRGMKRSLYLGGVSTPFIIRWPGKIPAGRVDTTSVIASIDLMPTLSGIVGFPVDSEHLLDGENIEAALYGNPYQRSKALYWEFAKANKSENIWAAAALRDGRWVLLKNEKMKRQELYDVEKDRSQSQDLSLQYPEITEEMSRKMKLYGDQLPRGNWKSVFAE